MDRQGEELVEKTTDWGFMHADLCIKPPACLPGQSKEKGESAEITHQEDSHACRLRERRPTNKDGAIERGCGGAREEKVADLKVVLADVYVLDAEFAAELLELGPEPGCKVRVRPPIPVEVGEEATYVLGMFWWWMATYSSRSSRCCSCAKPGKRRLPLRRTEAKKAASTEDVEEFVDDGAHLPAGATPLQVQNLTLAFTLKQPPVHSN